MIDDKKIEKAIEDYVRYSSIEDEYPGIEGNAFKAGAEWAINEFIKNLWHPADEMPNENNEVICMDKDSRTITYDSIANWWAFCRSHDVTHWLYVNDLLPKEGGKQ